MEQMMERFIKSIEKGEADEKKLAGWLKKDLDDMNMEKRQEWVNEVYRNLSEKNAKRLDDVLKKYNQGRDVSKLCTYEEVRQARRSETVKMAVLFQNFGEKYGKSNKLLDSYLDAQFNEIMKELSKNKTELQMAIDEVSERLSGDSLNVLKEVVKQYAADQNMQIRVSDMTVAKASAKELLQLLAGDKQEEQEQGLSEEAATEKRKNDFKFGILELERTIKQDDFQAIVDVLDRELDFEGRKVLDGTIRYHNKNGLEKYETRRVKLTDREKASSWQAYEPESVFRKKLKEFDMQLQDIKREGGTEKVKGGWVFRTYIALQNVIEAAADFIKNEIEYHQVQQEDAGKGDACEHEAAGDEKGPFPGPEDPFYAVMAEAYSEKGNELAKLLSSGRLPKEEAEKLFVMDVSYIRTNDAAKQNELFSKYSEGLNAALKEQGISMEAKNTILSFLSKFQNGTYDEQIKENIKNGISWEEFHPQGTDGRSVEPEEQKEEPKKEKKEEKKEVQKKEEKKQEKKKPENKKEQKTASEKPQQNRKAEKQEEYYDFMEDGRPWPDYSDAAYEEMMDEMGESGPAITLDDVELAEQIAEMMDTEGGKEEAGKMLADWTSDRSQQEIQQMVDKIGDLLDTPLGCRDYLDALKEHQIPANADRVEQDVRNFFSEYEETR